MYYLVSLSQTFFQMKIQLIAILLITPISAFCQDIIPYKYIFITKAQTAHYYRDTAASYSIGVTHTGDVFVGDRIVKDYAEIRKPAWEGGETKGWMHITDITIWKQQVAAKQLRNPRVVENAYLKQLQQELESEGKVSRVTIHHERSELEKYLLGPEAETPGTDISNNEIADTISSTHNEKTPVSSETNDEGVDEMADENPHKEIDRLAKEEGSRIYWTSMTRNIMLMVLIAAIVLLFNAFKKG
jgi:hypothetical protein